MSPLFIDAIRPTVKEFREAPKATIEVGTLLTTKGKYASDLVAEAKRVGDTVTEKIYLNNLVSTLFEMSRKTFNEGTLTPLLRAVTGRPMPQKITRISVGTAANPYDVAGSYEDTYSPNIRIPYRNIHTNPHLVDPADPTNPNGSTKYTWSEISVINAVVGKAFSQGAMAASEVLPVNAANPARSGYTPGLSVFIEAKTGVTENQVRDFIAALPKGHSISNYTVPGGMVIDVNPRFTDKGKEGISVSALNAAIAATKAPAGTAHKIDHDYKSVYDEANTYDMIIEQFVKGVKADGARQLKSLGLDAKTAAGIADATSPISSVNRRKRSIPSSIRGKVSTAAKKLEGRLSDFASSQQGFTDLAQKLEAKWAADFSKAEKRIQKLGGTVPTKAKFSVSPERSRQNMRVNQLALENDIRNGDIDPNDPRFEPGEIERIRKEQSEREKFSVAPPINSGKFKTWFAGSKVVDEAGKPLVVYHGSKVGVIDEFKDIDGENRVASKVAGFYFSTDERDAGDITYIGENGGVTAVYLRMVNPLHMNKDNPLPKGAASLIRPLIEAVGPKGEWVDGKLRNALAGTASLARTLGHAGVDGRKQRELYKQLGFDGIVDGRERAVFEPTQIKSVDNRGTFDPKNANIRYSVAKPNSFERDVHIRLTESDKTLWQKANKWRKRQLSPGGLLPKIVHDFKVMRDGMFHVGDDIIMRSLQSLETAVKGVHGKNYAHLTTKQKHVNIIKADIARLRAEGNELSAARAEALEKIIVDNKGEYVNRSYKVFDDPYWHQKIPAEVSAAALHYLAAQYGGDYAKAEIIMNELVKGENSAYTGMEGLIKESTLGAKDLTVLMARKNIAPEIRALMGENIDADLNYTRTMMKMNRLIHNTHFLNKVQAAGMGKFFFEPGDPNIDPDATVTMAGSSSKVLEPLNGLMTTPEVKQAFEDALGKSSLPQWLNNIVGVNGAIKYGKVVLSPATQVRNFVSAPFFVLQSGTFDLRHMKLATSAVWDQIKARDGNFVEYYRDLVAKNVLYDTPNAGMLQDLLDDSQNVWAALDHYSGLVPETAKSKIKHYNNIIKKVYRGADDFWKIVAYEGTKAQLAQAKPNWSTEQVETEAAKRTRDTVPTYSLTGIGMKNLGRFPLVGSFVAFSSEIIRTSMNNLKYIQADLADPDLKGLAYKRMAGMAMAHVWAASAAAMTAAMFGVDDDEEEAMRKLGSPWAENSSIAYLGRDDDGKMRSVDLSFVDPYNIFHKPLIALIRNQPWQDSFVGAAREVLSPFFGLDIAAGSLFELAGNSKLRSGAPIYNPEAPGLEQSAAIAEHLITTLGPGVVQPIVRIYKAANDIKTPQGRVYKMEDEIAGAFGLRLSTFDPKFAMYYRVNDFKEQLSNANSYLYGVASDINPVDDDALSSAFNTANGIRHRAYEDMMQIVNAARASGLSTQEIRKVLRVSNVSKKYANALARGEEAPKWNLGRTFLKGATKRAMTLIDRETAQEMRRRKRLMQQISRSSQ
jgi:hypothetical protein